MFGLFFSVPGLRCRAWNTLLAALMFCIHLKEAPHEGCAGVCVPAGRAVPGCPGSAAPCAGPGGHGAGLWQLSQSLGPVIWCLCFQKNFLQLFPCGAIQTLPFLAHVKTPVWLPCHSLRPHQALGSPCRAHGAGCWHLCAAGLGRGEQASRIYLRNTLL